MQLSHLLLTTLLGLSSSASASASSSSSAETTLHLVIPSSHALPNPNLLPASAHATLSSLGKFLSAPLSAANTFVFHNVTPGSYLADIHSVTHAFVPLRVDVSFTAFPPGEDDAPSSQIQVKAWETFRGNDWGNKGEECRVGVAAEGTKEVKVEVKVAGQKGYFLERSTFSIMSIFKNPIILLSLVSMGLFFGMPKLIENMDPEMRAEWEERQKENPMNAIMGAASGQQGGSAMGNFDMAAFLAGSGGKKDEGSSGSGSAPPAAGSGNKKRR